MKIVHYNNIDFDIDNSGKITRKATWHVMPDADPLDGWEDLADDVKAWAGKPGDLWRKPTADSQGYTADTGYVIESISCKSISRFMYEVSYSGVKRNLEAEMIGYPDISINENAEKVKTGKWRIHAGSLDAWLPVIGSVMIWAGEFYLCANVTATGSGGNSGEYDVTIQAKDMAVLMLGNPAYHCTNTLEKTKTAKWRVSNEAYEAFIADNDINGDASVWAGSGYYITNVSAEPLGLLGYNVTLEAKHISVRAIDIRRSVKFKGYTASGGAVNEIIFTGRWQVHKDSLTDFENANTCGQSASAWTGMENFIVTSMDPIKISDVEYEYTLNAQNPDDDGSSGFAPLNPDPRDDLKKGKTVVTTNCTEFMISPEKGGWFYKDGSLKELLTKNGGSYDWKSDLHCPIKLSSGTIPKHHIDKPFSCVTATVTRYFKGEPAQLVDKIRGLKRVINGELAGVGNGSWLLTSTPSTERILDKKGNIWTKYDATYQDCPFPQGWNAAYWETNNS